MGIRFDNGKQVFLLDTPTSTYVIRIFKDKYLLHGGWYASLPEWSGACVVPMIDRSYAPVPEELHGQVDFSLDAQPCEFPVAGHGDFRSPALEVETADGTIAADLFYCGHRIYAGKKPLPGLPSTYVERDDEADTLEIDLRDAVSGLRVTLAYTVWRGRDVICRHTVVANASNEPGVSGIYSRSPVTLRTVMSASLDFVSSRYRMLQLSGAHARERHVVVRDLAPGMQGVESRRCMSSHQQHPFIALLGEGATESAGEAYGFSFVYSGNFAAQVEVDQFDMSRVQVGINPYSFGWVLEPGESFCTPEVVMVRSAEGLGGMSRTYHDLYRSRLCRGQWRDRERPIVINNWEATYFNFDAQKLFALADAAAKTGAELFVLDDGWFGRRDTDYTSLGDWVVDRRKLPGGLEEVADGIHQRGMKFGLWFEPEMISVESDLYRAHPDWALQIAGRGRSLGRHQLVLDLSRGDVVDYLIDAVGAVLSSVAIDYVKWDYNRSATEVASAALPPARQQEVAHRYYLGLYRLMGTLVERFPGVLFESCSGGGGRFDPAILYYMPQTWTSDNTDALSRLPIQMGTSLVYPASAMSCHVSAVPNHQVGRITSLSQRGHVAMAGTYGYELDLTKLGAVELEEIAAQIALYKDIRGIVQFGDLYRLETPWARASAAESADFCSWMLVAKDGSRAVLTVVWSFAESNSAPNLVRLRGLDAAARYRCKNVLSVSTQALVRSSSFDMPASDFCAVPEGTVASGAELMNIGLLFVSKPQYGGSVQLLLEKV